MSYVVDVDLKQSKVTTQIVENVKVTEKYWLEKRCKWMSNYPPGVSELPGDGEIEKEYLFEIHGEITVPAYSEEGAKIKLKNEIKDLLYHAFLDGDIEVETE